MSRKSTRFAFCIAPALLLQAGASARADEVSPYSILNFSSQPAPAPDWIVSLGASLQYGPNFEGGSKTGFSIVPSDFDIRRPGEPAGFSAPDDAFSYTLFDMHGFSFGPAADYRGGRSRSDERDLVGIHSIPATLDAGAFAEYWLIENRLRAHVELRQAVRGRQGLVADLAADWLQPVDAFTFSFGPRVSAGNGTYMRSSYGISADEAALNPLVTSYRPSAGIKSVGALASVSYQFTPAWKGTIYDKYDRLVGDAADSPITTRIGSPNQNTVGISLSYSFGVKF